MFNQRLFHFMNFLKRGIPILGISILVFLICNIIFKIIEKPDNIIDVKNISAIKIDSSNKFKDAVIAHNAILIKTLQERMAIDASDLTSSANVKMQFRLFYTAILAGLSSLLFHKDIIRKDIIRRTLLFLIVIMYLLEVHSDDFYRRQKEVSMTKVVAVDSLINLKPNNSTWYKLDKWDTSDVKTIAAKWNSVSKRDITIPRKLKAALSPSLEQVVYYLIPWSVLFFFIPPYCLNKEKEYKRKYGSSKFKES